MHRLLSTLYGARTLPVLCLHSLPYPRSPGPSHQLPISSDSTTRGGPLVRKQRANVPTRPCVGTCRDILMQEDTGEASAAL